MARANDWLGFPGDFYGIVNGWVCPFKSAVTGRNGTKSNASRRQAMAFSRRPGASWTKYMRGFLITFFAPGVDGH
jgi:hypothetical protein